MSWYHQKMRNGVVSVGGSEYAVGADGKLSPEPSERAAGILSRVPSYEYREESKPAVEVVAPKKAAPAAKAAPVAKAAKKTPKTKPAAKKKPTAKKKKS